MIFLLTVCLWLLLTMLLTKAAEWAPVVFLICYQVLIFIAALKIVKTLFLG